MTVVMNPKRKWNKRKIVSQTEKSPYEKIRDENMRERKELQRKLNITNLSDADMSLLNDYNTDTDDIWANKKRMRSITCLKLFYLKLVLPDLTNFFIRSCRTTQWKYLFGQNKFYLLLLAGNKKFLFIILKKSVQGAF